MFFFPQTNESQYQEAKQCKAKTKAGDAAGALSVNGHELADGNRGIPEGTPRNDDVIVRAIHGNGVILVGGAIGSSKGGHTTD